MADLRNASEQQLAANAGNEEFAHQVKKRIGHRLKRLSCQEDLDSLVEDDRCYSKNGPEKPKVTDVPSQLWLPDYSSTLSNGVADRCSQGEEQRQGKGRDCDLCQDPAHRLSIRAICRNTFDELV